MTFPNSKCVEERFAADLISKAQMLVHDDCDAQARVDFAESEAERLLRALTDNDISSEIEIRAVAALTPTEDRLDQLEENVRRFLSSELESERRGEEQKQAEAGSKACRRQNMSRVKALRLPRSAGRSWRRSAT